MDDFNHLIDELKLDKDFINRTNNIIRNITLKNIKNTTPTLVPTFNTEKGSIRFSIYDLQVLRNRCSTAYQQQ